MQWWDANRDLVGDYRNIPITITARSMLTPGLRQLTVFDPDRIRVELRSAMLAAFMGVSKSWLGVYCSALGLFGLGREYLRSRLPSWFVDSAPSWHRRRILVATGFLLFGIALLVTPRV